MGDSDKTRRVSVGISVNKSIDELFEELTKKVIEVNGKKVFFTKSKNDIYNRALEFAVENINEWIK